MHKMLELLIPTKLEAFTYLLVSFLGLSTLAASDLWRGLLSSVHTDQQTSDTIGAQINQAIGHTTRLSDPQLVNSVIWGATAALALFLVGLLLHGAKTIWEDAEARHTRGGEFNFLTKLMIRAGAMVALLVSLIAFASAVLPAILRVYESRLTVLSSHWLNILWAIGAVISMSVCLYVFALLCRLVALKIRVFSEVYE